MNQTAITALFINMYIEMLVLRIYSKAVLTEYEVQSNANAANALYPETG